MREASAEMRMVRVIVQSGDQRSSVGVGKVSDSLEELSEYSFASTNCE